MLREPSTWAGFSALAALLVPELAEHMPALVAALGQIAGGVAAVAAIFTRERAA